MPETPTGTLPIGRIEPTKCRQVIASCTLFLSAFLLSERVSDAERVMQMTQRTQYHIVRIGRRTRRTPKKVFLLDGKGGYTELSYEEFQSRRRADSTYSSKRFIFHYGMLQEVTEADYKDLYRTRNHCRYIKQRDAKHGLKSVDAIGEERIADKAPDVADTVCKNEMICRLRSSLSKLEKSERELIDALYYEEMTERAFAKEYGVPKGSVNHRKKKIIEKLRNIF